MPVRLFSARRVADDLANGRVSPRQRGYYLAASTIVMVVVNYSALFAGNPAWTWLSLFEAIVIVVVTIYGLTACYESAGGDANSHFVSEFVCLSVPVGLTTTLCVWSIYWAIGFAFRETILGLSESHYQFAVNLHRIGSNFFGLLAFLVVVLTEVIFYFRMSKLFQAMRRAASDERRLVM